MRTAFSSIALNTGSSSPGELEMTCSTSEVAVFCSGASVSAELLHLGKCVFWVGERVCDLDRPAFQRGPANTRPTPRCKRQREHVLLDPLVFFLGITAARGPT